MLGGLESRAHSHLLFNSFSPKCGSQHQPKGRNTALRQRVPLGLTCQVAQCPRGSLPACVAFLASFLTSVPLCALSGLAHCCPFVPSPWARSSPPAPLEALGGEQRAEA